MVKTRRKVTGINGKQKTAEVRWKVGSYVWASMNKNYWPAVVVSHKNLNMKVPSNNKSWVFWFGDYRVSQIKNNDLCSYDLHFKTFHNQYRRVRSSIWKTAVLEAIREFGLPNTSTYNANELLAYAENGFKDKSGTRNDHTNNTITNFVAEKLEFIRNKNKENIEDLNVKIGASCQTKEYLKLMLSENRILENMCLACYTADIADEHPLFEGPICMDCKSKIKSTFLVIGDDSLRYFCAICACLGNMIVCSTRGCGLVYCSKCLDDLCQSGSRQEILKQDPWYCFVCDSNISNGLIKCRRNWKHKIQLLFSDSSPIISRPELPLIKKPIRVLSLFDGIGTGLTALMKLNITVDCYYACEVDEDAISVVKKNYPGGVTILGDIRSLTEDDIKNISPIDLLMGGSPCNDLSFANPYRKGLYDLNGSGVLFFEFYRILTTLKMYNSDSFFWFYENVASMSIQTRVSISRFLQCEPQLVDAAWVSSQSRPRLFWGNLPTLQNQQFINDGPNLQQYLLPGRTALVEKLRTVTTRTNSLKQGPQMEFPIINCCNLKDNINIIELEEVFGFPKNYTKLGNLSTNSRQKLLGKAWSVQTICRLLHFLEEYFQKYEEII